MQAEQETNNKAIAAQILCAFIAKSNVDSLLKEQKSSLVPENLESLFDLRHHLRHTEALLTRALEDGDGAA